jgi:hypothetical protein
MHPFRIAILIFFLGASIANIFAAKLGRDQLGPVATPAPAGITSSVFEPAPDPLRAIFAAATADSHRQVNDTALLRETVILTIAGIAWFLVPGRKQPG